MIKSAFLLTILVALGFIMPCSLSAGVKDSIGVTKINNVIHVRYLVSPGETIYGISTKFHVPISELLEINPELESGLKVGQIINIPYNEELVQKERARQSGNVVVHKVQSGETLYSLAKKYNVSVDQLMKWNNMDLKAGQEIVVGYKQSQPVVSAAPPIAKPEPVKPVEEKEQEKRIVKDEPAKENSSSRSQQEQVIQSAASPLNSDFVYPYDPEMKQILIIPFDPYLYFSDADHEIAAKSKIAPTKVREIFRRRMTALMQMDGYESIFLLGGKSRDSISDLNKIYSSVSYSYQTVIDNPYSMANTQEPVQEKTKTKSWINKQKERLVATQNAANNIQDKYEGQYFGVKIRNPEEFFTYFSSKYSVDYYIFVNQFEVKTNYENCLDRAAQDFERTFTTHFSIFDGNGKQIAGDKFKTFYNSNSSYIYTIVADNMDKIAQKILSELPPPTGN